jgi:hypothetical protein
MSRISIRGDLFLMALQALKRWMGIFDVCKRFTDAGCRGDLGSCYVMIAEWKGFCNDGCRPG